MLRRERPDDRRLHDRHERHVGIRRHDDRPQILRIQEVCHKDARRPVGRADDRDGRRIPDVKAEQRRHRKREENAELRRRAEQHQLRILQQRFKIDHRADADEQQQREQLVGDASAEQNVKRTGLRHALIHLRHRAGHWQIHQNRAEAHRQQQRRLHLFFDSQIDKQRADRPHHHLLPLQIRQIRKNRHTVSSQQGFHGFAHWTQRFRDGSKISIHLNEILIPVCGTCEFFAPPSAGVYKMTFF